MANTIHNEPGQGPIPMSTHEPRHDDDTQRGREAAQAVKERANAAWSDAKGSAQSKFDEQKDAAASSMHDAAEALRDAARRRGDQDPFARLTGSAAEGLEQLSGSLRNKDLQTLLRDVDSFARAQPVAFFGLSLAAGFLAVRFIKASSR